MVLTFIINTLTVQKKTRFQTVFGIRCLPNVGYSPISDQPPFRPVETSSTREMS
eukprot:m.13066 g.13066  ORF g.13066 m.13066 type:complete len:54 (+) comp4613_c0_seq1:5638-5799(+)